jgi:hypothetical protein
MGSRPHLMSFHASTVSQTRLAMQGVSARWPLARKMGPRTHSACGSRWAVLSRTLDLED